MEMILNFNFIYFSFNYIKLNGGFFFLVFVVLNMEILNDFCNYGNGILFFFVLIYVIKRKLS